MKAISLWQPWAQAMALGFKRIETRHWPSRYRGPLVIHAAKKKVEWPEEITSFFEIKGISKKDLPYGALVCATRLESCFQTHGDNEPEGVEFMFGNYEHGRYQWVTDLDHLERFDPPILWKGEQGFFDVPDEVIQKAVKVSAFDEAVAKAKDERPPMRPDDVCFHCDHSMICEECVFGGVRYPALPTLLKEN